MGARHRRSRLTMILIGIALIASACSGSSRIDVYPDSADETDGFVSQTIPTDSPLGAEVGSFSLPRADTDTEVVLAADDDTVLLVYFGFTYCPDVCPTTLADVKRAFADLGPNAADVDLAVITIDPGRDTPEALTEYVEFFVPDAYALRTDDTDRLASVADAFGVAYDILTNAAGEIEVIHSPYLYAVDDTGTIVQMWPFGAEPDRIANDLRGLLPG